MDRLNAIRTRAELFRVGERVRAKYLASAQRAGWLTQWYHATVRRVNADGTIDVDYDDGDEEMGVKPEYVRRPLE